jgi:adenylate cyclase
LKQQGLHGEMSGETPKAEDERPPASPGDSPVSHPPAHAHGHLPHLPSSFLEKLKRRNVGRVAILYIVVCYVILEPFEMFFHLLDLPVWTGRTVVFIMVLGFPAALLFAWIYEITPEGIRPSVEVDPRRSIARHTGRKLDRAIIAVLGFALAYFVVDKFWISKRVTQDKPVVSASRIAAASTPAVPAISEKSIAVLPFLDMSEKKDQEYFSDGLSEELIDMLANIPDLRVPARTSSFYFKGKQTTIGDIAKILGVAYVLEGSVRRSGQTLRITAQLIKADAGFHVWSETFDRQLTDVFKVQDEIAAQVVKALKLSLLADARPDSKRTLNLAANDLYMQALFYGHQLSATGTVRSVDLLSQALELDPNFALAWAELSRTKAFQAVNSLLPAAEVDAVKKEARLAAEKALALDPLLPEARVAMGRIYIEDQGDTANAAAEYRRALELNPRSSDALLQLGSTAGQEGRLDERVRLQEQALALDPLNVNILDVLGNAYLAVGKPAAAELLFRQELELSPDNLFANSNIGMALTLLGKPAEALNFMERGTRSDAVRRWARALIYPALGRGAEADALLVSLERDPGSVAPLDFAEIYAYRNDKARAFEWLDRQYRVDPQTLRYGIHADPLLANLRGEARFKALLKKLNLPE